MICPLILCLNVCGQQAPTPEVVRASMVLQPGLRIELVASDPFIKSPVAAAFDERGRLWGVEMPDYPTGPAPGAKPGGAIRILEDTNRDGLFDRSSLFAEGLLFANGLLPWRNGVIVTCAPQVLLLEDTDNDGKADRRTVLLEGLAEANPQLRPSFPVLTPGGWVQVSSGLRAGQVRRPGDPAGMNINLAGMDFRFRPDGSQLEATTGPGQFGNTLDSWGNRFVCDNRHHLRHAVLEAGFMKTNPWLAPGELLADVAAEEAGPLSSGGKVYPISRNWTTSNLHAGRFTAACGVLAFQGAGLGRQGSVFTCDPTGNLIHEERLTPQGLTFTARSPQVGSEFLAAREEWFRPVSLVESPDGSLLIIDMARAVIEHPEFMPPELRNRPDLVWGREKGRIWRLRATAAPADNLRPFLADADAARLVRTLADPSAYWRGTAHRLLLQKGPESTTTALRDGLGDSSPLARFLCAWLLAACNRLEANSLGNLLRDQNPHVVEAGLQIATSLAGREELLLSLVARGDTRLSGQVAQASRLLEPARRVPILAAVARQGRGDSWIRLAVLASATGCQNDLLRSVADADPAMVAELARQCGREGGIPSLQALLVWALGQGPDQARRVAHGVLVGLSQKGGGTGAKLLAGLPVDQARRLQELGAGQLGVASAPAQPVAIRQEAFLVAASLAADGEAVLRLSGKLLRDDAEPALRSAAARHLAGVLPEQRLGELTEGWKTQLPGVRGEVLDLAAVRPALMALVLSGVEAGTIPATDIDARRAARWMAIPDPVLASRAKKTLAACVPAPRDTVLARYQGLAMTGGDALRGREVFAKNCASCHKVENQGKDVGPDISDTRTKTAEALLGDILDPNRAIDGAYVAQVVTTLDGRVRTGVVKGATGGAITLVRADGQLENLARGDIEEMVSTGKSLMPEGLEKTVSPQQMADLIRYLKDWRYLDGKTPRAGK